MPTYIDIDIPNQKLIVSFPYDMFKISKIKSLSWELRSWDVQNKVWLVDISQLDRLKNIFLDCVYSPTLVNYLENYSNEKIKRELNCNEIISKLPLFPFQKEGILKGIKKDGFLYCSEPGTGKSIMSLVHAKSIGRNVLIIAPASLLDQWKNEVKKWFGEEAIIVRGPSKKRESLISEHSFFKIIGYECFRGDYLKFLDLKKMTIIFDEASKCKNKKSRISQVMYNLPSTTIKIALSGTPLENSLDNYWSIYNIINKGDLSWKQFEEQHLNVEWEEYGGNNISIVLGYKNIPQFIERIAPFSFRVKKSDIRKDLPPLSVEWRFIEPTPLQKLIKNYIIGNTKEIEAWVLLKVLDSMPKALLTSASFLDFKRFEYDNDNKKIDELEEILNEIGNQKIMIFTAFEKTAHFIHQKFPNSICMTGSTKTEDRAKQIEEFLKTPDKQILVSTDILSYGLDIPNGIDFMVLWDIPENPARIVQKINRIHRINSECGKKVYIFVGGVIEHDIYDILESKQKLFNQIVEGKTDVAFDIEKVNFREEILRKKYKMT